MFIIIIIIPLDTLTAFFQDKSARRLQYPLPKPPWPHSLDPPTPQSPIPVTPFTREEVTKVVQSLKNNTAPEYDGV